MLKRLMVLGVTMLLTASVSVTALASDLKIKDKVIREGAVKVVTPIFKGADGGKDIDTMITLQANKNTAINLYSLLNGTEPKEMDEAFSPLFEEDQDKVKASLNFMKGLAHAANVTLETQAKAAGKDFKTSKYYADASYNMYTTSSVMISYSQSVESYTGGEYDNEAVIMTTVNLKNGKTLTLADMFLPGSDYKERLAWVIDKQQKGDARLKVNMGKPAVVYNKLAITGNEKFCLDSREIHGLGLIIFYNPGEIAPVSEGVVEYSIPIDTIFDIMADI